MYIVLPFRNVNTRTHTVHTIGNDWNIVCCYLCRMRFFFRFLACKSHHRRIIQGLPKMSPAGTRPISAAQYPIMAKLPDGHCELVVAPKIGWVFGGLRMSVGTSRPNFRPAQKKWAKRTTQGAQNFWAHIWHGTRCNDLLLSSAVILLNVFKIVSLKHTAIFWHKVFLFCWSPLLLVFQPFLGARCLIGLRCCWRETG